MLGEIAKLNLITITEDRIQMNHNVREFSKKMCPRENRRKLYDMIIESHYDLMEYFYFNFDTNNEVDNEKIKLAQ